MSAVNEPTTEVAHEEMLGCIAAIRPPPGIGR
jgi:hypothetical protein